MNKAKMNFYAGCIVVAMFATALAFFFAPTLTHAALTLFDRAQSSTTGTSTLAYMTPGTGTTTLTMVNPVNTAYTSAVALVQVTATSTGVAGQVLLDARVEGSQDASATAGDWYPIANLATPAYPSNATTTYATMPYNSIRLALSTTTLGYSGNFGGTGDATRMLATFAIPTGTRHIRIIYTDPSGGGKYGLYTEIVTKKEAQQ